LVTLRTIEIEAALVRRAQHLAAVVDSKQFAAFCAEKRAGAGECYLGGWVLTHCAGNDEEESATWAYMEHLFASNTRAQLLEHLGFAPAQVTAQIEKYLAAAAPATPAAASADAADTDATTEKKPEAK
jgi:hypothetical protein